MGNLKNTGWLSVIGYALFLIGAIGTILGMCGLNLKFLSWLDTFGQLAKYVVLLSMVFGGIIVLYISKLDLD